MGFPILAGIGLGLLATYLGCGGDKHGSTEEETSSAPSAEQKRQILEAQYLKDCQPIAEKITDHYSRYIPEATCGLRADAPDRALSTCQADVYIPTTQDPTSLEDLVGSSSSSTCLIKTSWTARLYSGNTGSCVFMVKTREADLSYKKGVQNITLNTAHDRNIRTGECRIRESEEKFVADPK